MSLLNVSLLAGGLLIAVPIVLHLMMKRQPKHWVFPAMRFVQRRQIANSQRLQLRHWLLLALRCLAIALAAFAFARPTVATAAAASWITAGSFAFAALLVGVIGLVAMSRDVGRPTLIVLTAIAILLLFGAFSYGYAALQSGRGVMLGGEEEPVAAVILVDTSPRLNYRRDNQTRLEIARETVSRLLQELPSESQAAIVDTSAVQATFSIDLAAAEKAAQRLQIASSSRTIPDVLPRVRELLRESPLASKEVYIVTDLTQSAWRVDDAEAWRTRWTNEEPPATYVIDVGVDQPINVGLGDLKVSAESLPKTGELTIDVDLSSLGVTGNRTVEVAVDDPDPSLPIRRDNRLILPKSVNRGVESVAVKSDQPSPVRFRLRGLAPGVHHGMVRLVEEDGLAIDDVRHFTVEVEDARPLLIASPPGVPGRDFAEAIAPEALRDAGEVRFHCRVVAQSELPTEELSQYEAVCLLDPTPLASQDWSRLANYARDGGGLMLFLGPHAEPIAPFNEPAAVELLGGRIGGRLQQPVRTGSRDVFFDPRRLEHPMFAPFRGLEGAVPWNRFPVFYYWPMDQLDAAARIVASYSDGRPAVVERTFGKGRVLTVTTPAAELLTSRGRPAWNELWAGEDAWPWFVFLNESLRYAAGMGEGKLNYWSGETAVLANDAGRYPQRYQLFTPSGEMQEAAARDDRLTIRMNDGPGSYRLKGNLDRPIVRGFSANLPAASTELTRLVPPGLDALFGEKKYQSARNLEQLNRVVGQQRVGQELYPYVMLMLVLALGLEHVLSNRFYRGDAAEQAPAWSTWWRRGEPAA